MTYYAHSKENEPPENWQPLEEHLANVANLAAKFADVFGAKEWGRIAGLWHDLGKSSKEFQGYLRFSNNINDEFTTSYAGKVDHSTAGAKCLNNKLGEQVGKLLAYTIAGHHSGLPNGKDETGSSLYARLRKEIPEYCAEVKVVPSPPHTGLPFLNHVNGFNISFFIRILYSCLVDADFLDTEKFMNIETSNDRKGSHSLTALWEKLEKHILTFDSNSSFINKKRAEILTACFSAAHKEPGFYSLTVPTGGGKTISSLAFAIKHALKHGQTRIIYVIPYTSIIEQNAQVFRDILGDDAVIEHHSNFDPENETRFSKLATQNWDAPVIVTTNVQFFESLFANRSSRCRKLHNIANSVVILDEAQMLPLNLLSPCLEAMKALINGYHTTVVLCTATQPALIKSDEFTIGLPKPKEIIPNPKELYESFKRVSVSVDPKSLTDDALAKQLCQHNQVLCIVSNKRQARELYDLIAEKDGLYHLSSMMCPEHRTIKFKEIKEKLSAGECCRVISTQLIEAGVDIDFPFVFRAIAGIDSIAQAAGRCNREGKQDKGIMRVFRPDDPKNIPPGFLRQCSQIGEQVLRHHQRDVLSLSATHEYFQRLYWQNSEYLDTHGICGKLEKDVGKLNFPFKDVAKEFAIINSQTHAIIIPFGDEGDKVCTEIRNSYKFVDRAVSKKAQRLSVQIHPMVFNKLRLAGAIESFMDEKYWVLINLDIYHDAMGLLPDDPSFYKVDTLIL